ncbi:MAG TPA: hypothetical protein VGO55_18365 [Allosphingosinicella sp.]|jgi:hypothetical protein|nr:hypothetical protein [Allosphingosinicella sp.]
MNDNAAIFILLLIAMVGFFVIGLTWLKQRAPKGGTGELEAKREVELLSSENAGLKGQVGRLEERIAVLERIATDPAERTAREIEQLR